MFLILKDILTRLNYFLIFVVVAFVVLVMLVLSSNIQLVASVISHQSADIFTKFRIIVELIGSIQTNFSIFSIFSMASISVLLGANISAMVYLIKEVGGVLYKKSFVGTGGGVLTAVLGGGCAACGTLVVTPLLSMVGLGGVVSFLPFAGQEFNILAIIVLSVSFWGILKKIKLTKGVCEV